MILIDFKSQNYAYLWGVACGRCALPHYYPTASRWSCGEQTCCCSLCTITTKLLQLLRILLWSTFFVWLPGTTAGPQRSIFWLNVPSVFLYWSGRKWSRKNLHRRNQRQHEEPPQPHCDLIQAFEEKLPAITASLCAMRGPGATRVDGAGLWNELCSTGYRQLASQTHSHMCFQRLKPLLKDNAISSHTPSLVSYQARLSC